MVLTELGNEQRRQLIDAQQAYAAWRDADRDFRHGYDGSMRWKRIRGHIYLYRNFRGVDTSLGPRDDKTERIKADYVGQRTNLRDRVKRLRARVDGMAKVNRAMGLGRVPRVAARVLRKLDTAGLLGVKLFVVGTQAMFAYEARAGVRFDSDLLATSDIDLLIDTRTRLSLAVLQDVGARGILGILQQADRSFTSRPGHYRAVNDEGFYVDFIRPLVKDEPRHVAAKLADDDLAASAILGLQWLVNAPRFEQIALGDDGLPVSMCCIDPRAFALHKYWLGTRAEGREAIKCRRDVAQARAVATLAVDYLDLPFRSRDLTALPLEFLNAAGELVDGR